MLLLGVEGHHLLPGGGHLVQAVVAAEVHQIEDVLLKAAAAEAGAGLEELPTNAAVGTDGAGYFTHIDAGGFAEGGDAVDRADALRQEGVGGELAELTAPEIGAQNALGRHPLAVDAGEGLDGGRVVATDQHAVGLLEIGDGGTFGEELGIGEHREAGADAIAGLDMGGGEDRLHGFGGAHGQGDRARAATVRAQAAIQRRSLAWPAPRPRLLVGVFAAMNTRSAEAIASSTAVEKCMLRPRQRPTTSARPGSTTGS